MGEMKVPNPFDSPLAARCYVRGRPAYHEAVVRRIRERLNLPWPVPLALDVGCGSGQSADALRPLARQVLGIDPSRPMLAEAPRTAGLGYALAGAERLPVRDASVSLLTCGASYHWFDAEPFFREARRVLHPGGAGVVYDNFFTAVSRGSGAFSDWYRDEFVKRFPRPPRNPEFSPGAAESAGFSVGAPEAYELSASITLQDLAFYLLSQSNMQASLAPDPALLPAAEAWLKKELRRFFGTSERQTFEFGGPLWFLTRS
jgi:SAM-dependent methyltransferase